MPTSQQKTGLTSTSIERAPAPLQSFVRGKSGHVPFWPGGLDQALLPESSDGSTTKGLRTKPPGLSRGLRLAGVDEDDNIIDLEDTGGANKSFVNEVRNVYLNLRINSTRKPS